MEKYVPHEDDTTGLALKKAAQRLCSAQIANRFFVFSVGGRIELVFGTSRHLTIADASEFHVDFHSASVLDLELAESLRDELAKQIDFMRGVQNEVATGDG